VLSGIHLHWNWQQFKQQQQEMIKQTTTKT